MSLGSKPQRIEPEFKDKVWGSPRIEPWFESRGDRLTGEVWFPAGELLIKFLFTSQHLSVQVHPDDEYARVHENARGKTEMWHILRADPGARIALGFQQPISVQEMIAGARSGEIMELLNWVEVHAGDTYFVPAHSVHAIGAGIALCEIQQNSDITYRLYDYGRDRPLHLRQAEDVADPGQHPGASIPGDLGDGVQLLAECPYFRTYRARVERARKFDAAVFGEFLIVLEGAGLVNGLPVSPGQVLEAPSSSEWLIEPERPAPSGSLNILLTGRG
jgi:mannose-6-phosphate isomerase